MEYKEIVEYLKTYEQLYNRMIYLEGQILGVKAITYEPKSGGVVSSINTYLNEKDLVEKEMVEIESTIDKVRNNNARYVLVYRFVQFKKLEDVAIIMGYSTRQISRYYKKAMDELQDVM